VVRDGVVAWLGTHGMDAEAQFVYKAWLDAGGEREVVREGVVAWLGTHGIDVEAGFIYPAWLNAGGEREVVRDGVVAWLGVHSTDVEARFVCEAWLDTGGERNLVSGALVAWLGVYGTEAEANYVYKSWLDAGGELNVVHDAVVAWLELWGAEFEADYVCRAWLEAGGAFVCIESSACEWLHRYRDRVEAVYITKFLTKQRDLPDETVIDILFWCRAFPTHEDAIWRLSQLGWYLMSPALAEDVLSACEAVLAPLISSRADLERVTRTQLTTLLSYLIGAPGLRSGLPRERVDILLLTWLRNPLSFGRDPLPHVNIQQSSCVQRVVDLVVAGGIDVTSDRECLERFLQWVDEWEIERKRQLIPKFRFLRRNYPAEGLWEIVKFEELLGT
jgi:hypothetical protein